MHKVYQAKDNIEAQLLKDYLASYHIQTVVQGEYLSGAAGELPAMQFPVLWVLENRDLTRAGQLVDQFLTQEGEVGTWECPACGELNEVQFHLCWNCTRIKVSA